MRLELKNDGYNVNFISINASNATEQQQKLADACSFPLLQDTEEVDAWGVHGGGKDDFFIYGRSGTLQRFLPFGGAVNTNLLSEEGYNALKFEILSVVASGQ